MLSVSRTANSNRKYFALQSVNLLSASHTHVSASYLPDMQQSLLEMFRSACLRYSNLPFMFFRSGLSTTIPEKPRDGVSQPNAQAADTPNPPFNSLSYAKVERMVNHVTAALQYLGIRRGDMVGIMAVNSPLWLISDLAIMARGAITVPIPTTSNHERLAYITLHSGMKLIITQKQYVSRILGVSHRCDNLRLVISLDTLPDSPSLINAASMVFGTLEQELLTTSFMDQLIYDEFFTSMDGSPSTHSLTSSSKSLRAADLAAVSNETTNAINRLDDLSTGIGSNTLSIDSISYLNEIRHSKVSTQAHLEDRLGSYYLRDGKVFTCFATGKPNACLAPFPAVINQTSTKYDRRALEHTVDKNLMDISSYLRTHISDANSIENFLLDTEPVPSQNSEVIRFSNLETDEFNMGDHPLDSTQRVSLAHFLQDDTPLNIISLDVLMQKTKHLKYVAQNDVCVVNTDICSLLYKSEKKSGSSTPPIIGFGITYDSFIAAMISLASGYLPGHMRSPCDPYINPFTDVSETPDMNKVDQHQSSPSPEKTKKGHTKTIQQDFLGKQNKGSPSKHLPNTFAGRGSGSRAFTSDVILPGSPSTKPFSFTNSQPSFLSHLPLFMPFERVLEHTAYIRGYQIYYSSGIDRQVMSDLRDSQCTLFVGTCQIYQRIYKAGLTYLAEISDREIDRIAKDIERRADKIDSICQESMFLDQVGVDQLTSGPFGPLTINLNIDLDIRDYLKPSTDISDPSDLAIQKMFANSQKALIAASRVVPERISNDDYNRILNTFSSFRSHRLVPYCKSTEKVIIRHHRIASMLLSPIIKANGRLSQSFMVSLKTIFYQTQLSTLKFPSALKFINSKAFGGNTTHFILIGGPLQHNANEFFRVGTGGIFSTIYGVSEFLGLGCYTYYHDLPSYEGLIGRSMPGISAIVMDCKDKCEFSLEKDGVGELCFKGKMATIGSYYGSSLFREAIQIFKFCSESFQMSNLAAVKILKKKFEHMGLTKIPNLAEKQHHIAVSLLYALSSSTSLLSLADNSQSIMSKTATIETAGPSALSLNCNADSQMSSETKQESTTSDNQFISKDVIKRPVMFEQEPYDSINDTGATPNEQHAAVNVSNKKGLKGLTRLSIMSTDDVRLNPPLMSPTYSSTRQSITISELKLNKLTSSSCGITASFREPGTVQFNHQLESCRSNTFVAQPARCMSQNLSDNHASFRQMLNDICSQGTTTVEEVVDPEELPETRSTASAIMENIPIDSTNPCITETFLDTYSKRITSSPLFQSSFAYQKKEQLDFKTDKIFDEDGYYHTGDLVKILPDGRLLYLRSLYKHLVLGKYTLDRELADRVIEGIPYIITSCLFAKPDAKHTVCIINCKKYLLEARYREQKIKIKEEDHHVNKLDTLKTQHDEGDEDMESDGDVAIVEKGLTPSIQSMSSTISKKISSRDGLLCERYGKDEDDLMRIFLPSVSPAYFTRTLARAVENFVIEDITKAIRTAGLTDVYIPRRIKIYIDREMDFNRVLYTYNGRKNYKQFEYVFKSDIKYLYSL